MNKCKICSREFEGKFCPYCGTPASEESLINEISKNSLPLSSNFNELLKNPVPTSVSEFASRVMTEKDVSLNIDNKQSEEKTEETVKIKAEGNDEKADKQVDLEVVESDDKTVTDTTESTPKKKTKAEKKAEKQIALEKQEEEKGKEKKQKIKKAPNYVKKNGGVVTVYNNYKKKDRAVGISFAFICIAVIVVSCLFVAPKFSKYWIENYDITTATFDTMQSRLGEKPIAIGENEFMWSNKYKNIDEINKAIGKGEKVKTVTVKAIDNKIKVFIYNADYANSDKKSESITYSNLIVSNVEQFNKITFEEKISDGSIVKAYLADCYVIGDGVDFTSNTKQTYRFSDGLITHSVEIEVI